MKRRERQNQESMPLRNLAHPFLKALRKMCKFFKYEVKLRNSSIKYMLGYLLNFIELVVCSNYLDKDSC